MCTFKYAHNQCPKVPIIQSDDTPSLRAVLALLAHEKKTVKMEIKCTLNIVIEYRRRSIFSSKFATVTHYTSCDCAVSVERAYASENFTQREILVSLSRDQWASGKTRSKQ